MSTYFDDPIWGCEAIAHTAGLFKADVSIRPKARRDESVC
jgi:hypothetical protein